MSSVPYLVDLGVKRSRVGRAEISSVIYPFQLEFGSKWYSSEHVQGVQAQEDAKIGRKWRAKDMIRRDRGRPTMSGAHACLQCQLRLNCFPTFGWERGSLVEDEYCLVPTT